MEIMIFHKGELLIKERYKTTSK